MVLQRRTLGLITGAITLSAALAAGCGKSKSDSKDDDETSPPAGTGGSGGDTTNRPAIATPGALLVSLDASMGSVGFAGQSGAGLRLADADWVATHCEATGGGMKEEFWGKEDIAWGCRFAIATDGPDTPRGGLARVKGVACSVDKLLTAGTFTMDGTAQTVDVDLTPDCWGQSFADMAAEYLPEKVNAETGYVRGPLAITGHDTVPATMVDDPTKWEKALEIDFEPLTGENKKYEVVMRMTDPVLAAVILSKDGDREDVFGITLTFSGGEEDLATFRYVGRFPYSEFGDGSLGSRHLRMLVSGPYTGNGTFSEIRSGGGFQVESFENSESGSSGRLSAFAASADGLATETHVINLPAGTKSGDTTATWSGAAGTTPPAVVAWTGSDDNKKSLLTPSVDDGFTSSAAFFKASGPFEFTEIAISGD